MVWTKKRQIHGEGADLLLLLAIVAKCGFPISDMSFVVSDIVEKNGIVNSKRVDN